MADIPPIIIAMVATPFAAETNGTIPRIASAELAANKVPDKAMATSNAAPGSSEAN